jgi:hypothetical protein
MACARIPEFESYDPSHAVVSFAVVTGASLTVVSRGKTMELFQAPDVFLPGDSQILGNAHKRVLAVHLNG